MIEITSSLVRKLRERTGAGIMDCKKALLEANGSITLAIENMRKSGNIKAEKKAKEVTLNGMIKVNTDENYGVILEVNCQTDFVAKSNTFRHFAEKILYTAFSEKIDKINVLKERFEEERVSLVAKISENINIRRVSSLRGDVIGSYLHNNMRIGVLVAAVRAKKELARYIAMHIAASQPKFIKTEDISTKALEKEHRIQVDAALQSGKSKEIAEKIAKGRVLKFINEVSLINQAFVIDTQKTVGQILKENNANVIDFIRFEVGEETNN